MQHESKQAAELLTKWEPIGTEDVLELLSAEFKSVHVRRHAVASLTLVSFDCECLSRIISIITGQRR